MDIFGAESAGSANHDPAALFFPFQNRPRADPQFLAHVRWNGDLSLSRDPGLCDCHVSYYRGNGDRPGSHPGTDFRKIACPPATYDFGASGRTPCSVAENVFVCRRIAPDRRLAASRVTPTINRLPTFFGTLPSNSAIRVESCFLVSHTRQNLSDFRLFKVGE